MNYCTACGSPVLGDARFCGNCGVPVASPQTPAPQAAAQTQRQAEDLQVWTPGAPSDAPGDFEAAVRAAPGPAIRAAAVVVLVVIALIAPWEYTAVSIWDESSNSAAASNVWVLLALLLVGVSGAAGFFAANVEKLGLPIPVRGLQALLVAPLGLTALIASVRMLAGESLAGASVAVGLVAAVLALQIRATSVETDRWRIAAMALLGVGGALTLWQLRDLVDVGQVSATLALMLLVSVGWIPALAVWFILGLRDHKPAEWAALVTFGVGLLLAMMLLDAGADVGLSLILVGATAGLAPGMAKLMKMSSDPAERWLQWVAGVMVLWIVAGAVTGLIGLLGAVMAADRGVSAGGLVWVMIWGTASAVVAGVARKQLMEDPAKGRKIAVIFAGASILLYIISLAAVEVDLSDPAALMTGAAVPVVVILMMTMPRSVNERYGSLVSTGS